MYSDSTGTKINLCGVVENAAYAYLARLLFND